MRSLAGAMVIGCLILALPACGVQASRFDDITHGKMIVKGQFGVRFSENASLDGVTRGFGLFRLGIPSIDRIFDNFRVEEVRPLAPCEVGRGTAMSRIYLVRIPENMDDARFIEAMRANPNVAEIMNDIAHRVHVDPDDPSYSQQWALYQASRKDIHAPEAWEIETGSDTVVVAIIDTGVNYRHPDLKNNIWINPGEDIDGDRIVFDETDFNGYDDDGNGYRDDVIGYDFFTGGDLPAWGSEDGGVRDNDPNDYNGHGTHCAGIVAGVSNNGLYGAGIAGGWGPHVGDRGVQIMCLRAGYSANDGGDEMGLVLMSAVVEAINYAADNGADVISYSAGSSVIPGLPQAVSKAMDSGIVFCAAADNHNCDCPDSYFDTYPGILTVAATNSNDQKWVWSANSGSNYGSWVEISAPGEDIYSTYSNHYTPSYATLTGTSMATPMVAGLAALIKSHDPSLGKTEIESIILSNADNIDAENPSYVGLLGAGRINAYNCLQNAPVARFDASPRVGPAPLTVNFTDLSPATIFRLWTFGDGDTSPDENPSHVYTNPGLYTVSLEVTDPNGTYTKTRDYFICATADSVCGDSVNLVPALAFDSFAVPVYMSNTVPLERFVLAFDWDTESGTAWVNYRGASLDGTRGENFDTVITRTYTQSTGVLVLEFIAQAPGHDELPPGDGPVANLWFSGSGSGALVIDTTSVSGYSYSVQSRYVDYLPEFHPLRIEVWYRGDANDDGLLNVADAVAIVNFVFKGGTAPPSTYSGDANGDGQVNIADAVYMINYVFKGGPPPPP